MIVSSLDGKWKVRDAPLRCQGLGGLAEIEQAGSEWMVSRVPGEIHLDLVRAGRMREPLVGLNAKKSRWPEERSWWFARSFDVPAQVLQHERQELVFDGLDLYAQVFLNGRLLGESKNALVPCVFDVRHKLKEKRNRLVVRLTSGEELVDGALRLKGKDREKRQAFQGLCHLRKPQFTYGWDWVDALPNIGIWRGVRIKAHSGVVLRDISVNTRLSGSEAAFECAAVIENLHPWSERVGQLDVTVKHPDGKQVRVQRPFVAQVGRSTVSFAISIPQPRLWWPNGMGDQPLYPVTVRTVHAGNVCDQRDVRTGLRTIELDRSAIRSGGSRFCIRVNGQDVFCKGGNWIPADAIVARVDAKKYETLVGEAKNANLNMLRIWGGGVYESPDFYDACDRAGILVWQDFMFACSEYPDADPGFRDAIRAEAESVIMRLRHHPSIALWCGGNENIWGFADWWNAGRPATDKDARLGGSRLYNQILPAVCHALDPDRPYWPSSPVGGETPNSESDGDCHWWHQGPMSADINRRISHEVFDECTARFVSEYGVIGPCHWESIQEFLEPADRHPESQAWKEHTNVYEKDVIAAAIQRHYADPDGLDVSRYILYGQMYQALMYGNSFEALRFRKHDRRNDCQGALIWMYNDCWGETGWTPIDYYLRRKPSYYAIRNACAPVKAIVRRRADTLVTRVVNDTLQTHNVILHYGWIRVDGTKAQMRAKPLTLSPNTMVEAARLPVPSAKYLDPRAWIYTAYLDGESVESSPSIWTLVPHRELATEEPVIHASVRGREVQLVSGVYCHGVHYKDGGKQKFSDNYFDLLPGIPKSIQCVAPVMPKEPLFVAVK